jgi:hypothetical protein
MTMLNINAREISQQAFGDGVTVKQPAADRNKQTNKQISRQPV